MKLSIVIPCFNAEATIGGLLESLARQNFSGFWEVIVSDNGSTDNSLAIVEQYKARLPNLRIVDSSSRQGAAHARNAGARTALGDAFVFIDADDEVADNYLSAIAQVLSSHDLVASRFDIEKLNEPWVRQTHGNPLQDGLKRYNYPPYLFHSSASGLGVRRHVHEAVGGFDETMPSLEDTDYCWRIQHRGTAFHFVPDAVVYYRYRETLSALFRQAYTYASFNVLLYKKYRPLGMPKLTWEYPVAAWKLLIKGFFRIRTKGNLAAWVWQLAWRLGRLRGCARYRVVAP